MPEDTQLYRAPFKVQKVFTGKISLHMFLTEVMNTSWRALQMLCHVWSVSGMLLHFPKSNLSDVLPNFSRERRTLLMAAVTQVNFQAGIPHSHLLVISSLAKHSTQLLGNFLVHLIPLICSSWFKYGKMQVIFCP